jgi:hypothetical protein
LRHNREKRAAKTEKAASWEKRGLFRPCPPAPPAAAQSPLAPRPAPRPFSGPLKLPGAPFKNRASRPTAHCTAPAAGKAPFGLIFSPHYYSAAPSRGGRGAECFFPKKAFAKKQLLSKTGADSGWAGEKRGLFRPWPPPPPAAPHKLRAHFSFPRRQSRAARSGPKPLGAQAGPRPFSGQLKLPGAPFKNRASRPTANYTAHYTAPAAGKAPFGFIFSLHYYSAAPSRGGRGAECFFPKKAFAKKQLLS